MSRFGRPLMGLLLGFGVAEFILLATRVDDYATVFFVGMVCGAVGVWVAMRQ